MFYLVLPAAGAARYGIDPIKFYCTKSLFRECKGAAAAATAIGCSESDLEATVSAYNRAAQGTESDRFGKTVFPYPIDLADTVYVAMVTPVVHYCMGGVRIGTRGEVLGADGKQIPGLYAAGEVTGGVHGKNRCVCCCCSDGTLSHRAAESCSRMIRRRC